MNPQKKLSYKLLFLFLVISGVVFFTFIISSTIIGLGVRERVEIASSYYFGDHVEVLIRFLDNPEKHSIKDRNSAVWALGQLGDKRALPVLKKYYTGEICSHETELCQCELENAIKHIESGFNITRFIWKSSLKM